MKSTLLVCRLVFCAIVSIASYAQTRNARLEGTVTDQSGAVIPGASVSALNTDTQAHTDTTTGVEGHYMFPDLQPGRYSLHVTAPGFRISIVRNIELNVGGIRDEDVKLEVGQTSETIEVLANAATVQTTESQVSSAITVRSIDTLPQLNRTPITLAIFQPGVQIDVRAGQDASFSRINGLRQGSNNATLDGIDVNDAVAPRLGLSMTANNVDSVEEFRVITQGGKAEYGRSAGGQVELITRSGTNDYHGSAFDYLRNTDLNANDFFNNQSGGAVPKYIRNLYGGSFGGPIIHNKTFIFGNFQGNRTRQEVIRNRTVPTLNAKQGLFTYAGPQTFNIAAADPAHRGIDPAVAKILALYPAPNNLDAGDQLNTAGFRFNNPVPSLEDQFTIRGDHHVSNNLSVFLRWSWQRNSSIDNLNSADATFPGQINGTQGGHRWGFATGADWTITPTLVNEFRIGHQSASVDFLRPNRPNGPTVNWNGSALALTDVFYTSFAQGRNSPVNDITENLTKVLGKHTFKMGTNLRFVTQYGYNYANVYPTVTMNANSNGDNVPSGIAPAGLSSSALTNFNALYTILLGRIDQVSQTFYSDLTKFGAAGAPRVRNFKIHEYGYFFQDDWRVNRKLTLNLGLRWEFFGLPTEEAGLQGVLSNASAVNANNQITSLTIQKSGNWYNNDWNNFAPRFGFAYDLTGDGKTAIRGNVGVFYDRSIGATISGVDGNTPGFSQNVPVYPNLASGSDVRYSDNYPLPQAPGQPQLTLPLTRSTSVYLYNPNLRSGYVGSWGLTIQRELVPNTVLQVGYLGNRGIKLFMNEDVNQPRIYTNGFLQDFQQMQAYVANNTTAVPAGNVMVRLFGSPASAVTALNATNFTQGRVGTVVNTIDRTYYGKFAGAGIPDTYFRNYPQYNLVVLGTNDGRSYYDSLQLSLRRTAGALHLQANYTWSKSMDNISAEGNGFTIPIDTYNLRLNRALSDFDRPHSFNMSAFYTLPLGHGKFVGNDWPRFLDTILGQWQVGGEWILQAGQPFTVSSQRATTAVSNVSNSYAQYNGTGTGIGGVQKLGNGVFYFTPAQIAQFTYPIAGQIGDSGRNIFRNPVFNEVDASLVKRFKITERQAISFRAEAYNVFNHPNFGLAAANLNINNIAYNADGSVNMAKTSFGKFDQTLGTQVGGSSARTMQLALRYDF